MIAVCVTFTIKPGMMDAFLGPMQQQARDAIDKEPGCHRFDICTGAETPQDVFLYELYDDRAAFDVHLDSDHFRAFDARVADMVAEKRVQIFSEVAIA